VISGYKVPHDIWQEVKHDDYEDYFIDLTPQYFNGENTFFGSIIRTIDEDDFEPYAEYDSILSNEKTIVAVRNAFERIFTTAYLERGLKLPKYSKYIGIRWV
jgi:hypothetical protein